MTKHPPGRRPGPKALLPWAALAWLGALLLWTAPTGAQPPATATEAPAFIGAITAGRDLLLDRRYEEARRYFSDYGASHPDDPAGPIGEALVGVMERIENRDFTASDELDRTFEKARAGARRWGKSHFEGTQGEFLVGAAEAIQALWWLKTGHSFRGIPRMLSAVSHIKDAALGAEALADAQGAYGMYLYLRARYGRRFLFFVPDTREEGKRAAEECAARAPILGPLCDLFLLYVAKWERRWDDLDERAEHFRQRYPGSTFAALIQAEGLLAASKPERALSVLTEAGRRAPQYGLLHYWLGRIYWDALAQPLPAQEAWEYALERGLGQPERGADAQAGLGEIALAQGQLAEARIRFEWAEQLDGDNERAQKGWKELAEREEELKREGEGRP